MIERDNLKWRDFMANRVEPKLIKPLFETLQKESLITLATIDYETTGPNIHAISWVYAPSEEKLLFAVDNRSRIIKNIENNEMVVVTIMANESVYSITGRMKVQQDIITGLPLKLALLSLTIGEVRDVMFYGSRISQVPKYEKTYDVQAATKLDNQVMDSLKKCTR